MFWEGFLKLGSTRENKDKSAFLKKISGISFAENSIGDVVGKLTFSFKYFDNSQDAGQDFRDWNQKQLYELLDKLKEYSKQTQLYWHNQRCGKGSLNVLEYYDSFPENTDFTYPGHVPDNVRWSRFRMESAVRLIGFFIYPEMARENPKLSEDTFYVVFLDRDHRFYKKEKR